MKHPVPGKKLRRFLCILLSLVMLFSSLSGCGLAEYLDRFTKPDPAASAADTTASPAESCLVRFTFNDQKAGDPPLPMEVPKGERFAAPGTPLLEGLVFMGWFAAGTAIPYDFTKPVEGDLDLMGIWIPSDVQADSDEDGLTDAVEQALGTDPAAADSDGDGLPDGLEYSRLQLDPLKPDTDGNGTPDAQEDGDGDGLANLEELTLGTDPMLADSDADGLGDNDEQLVYHTLPLVQDTDGDGVLDGTEVRLGTDPLAAETAFVTEATTAPASPEHPVSVSVSALTDAAGAGTLSVAELIEPDILALTPASLGYLAPAVEIRCDGSLTEAELIFHYDPSLDDGSGNFAPTICWYNEAERELIPVPGQVREEGLVRACVTHFSTYTLIDLTVDLIDTVGSGIYDITTGPLTDANQDGLPDVYARMINAGELKYENTFLLSGVLDMYGEDDDDWDDDGLKNGEEIRVSFSVTRNALKIYPTSNPIFRDTDGDGISDYDEVKKLGTSPLRYDHRSVEALNDLLRDTVCSYSTHKADWRDNFAVFLDPGRYRKAKECLINYFYEYAAEETIAKNAAAIAEHAKQQEAVKVLGLVSNLTGIYKSCVDVLRTGADAADAEANYYENLDIRKNMIFIYNHNGFDLVISEMPVLTLPQKINEQLEKFQGGDVYDQVEAVTKLISQGSKVLAAYAKGMKYHSFRMGDDISRYEKSAEALTGRTNSLGKVSTAMTVVADLAEGAVNIAAECEMYGKLKANAEAYTMYLDLLLYMKENAKEDYVRFAAEEVGKLIVNEGGNEYFAQLNNAIAVDVAETALKTTFDVLATVNPYARIAKLFLDLYPMTGMSHLASSNIYIAVMTAITDACKAKLDGLINTYSYTFSYAPEDTAEVEKYMVQLAQGRIIGEYYWYEYLADNSGAGWIASLFSGKQPAEYRADYHRKVQTLFDYANRLQLKLSPNLPYSSEFVRHLPEDELTIPLTPELALKEAAGLYMLSSGAGAWSTLLWLKEDGSFSGSYADMDMGLSGVTEDGQAYDGTQWERRFSGRFTVGENLTDTSCRLIRTELVKEGEDGAWRIEERYGRTRHVNAAAVGLEGDSFVLYSPSEPASSFSFQPWLLYGNEQKYMIGTGLGGEIRGYFVRINATTYDSASLAFTDFIVSGEFRTNYKIGGDVTPDWALYDMNADGTPELIITNGYAARTDRMAYIFAYDLGKVIYLGIGPTDAYILDDPAYPGIFGKFETNWTYYYLNEFGNLMTESVAAGGFEPPFEQRTANDALFRAFLNGPRKYLYR